MGDFNCKIYEESISNFDQSFDFKNLMNEPTYFKNPGNLTFIDLIMTNRAKCMINSITIETELSDFHKTLITVLKTYMYFLLYKQLHFWVEPQVA